MRPIENAMKITAGVSHTKEFVALGPKLLLTIPGHESTVDRFTYLPGGKRLVICSYDIDETIQGTEDMGPGDALARRRMA